MINPGDVFYRTNLYAITIIMCVQNEYETRYKSCTALEIQFTVKRQKIVYLSKAQLNHLYKKLNDI